MIKPIKISENDLINYSYANEDKRFGGNDFERVNWIKIENSFKNHEIFWRYFIVPMTNRMKGNVEKETYITNHRIEVNNIIKKLALVHFLIFYNLINAFDNIGIKQDIKKHVEYYFINLGTVLDLVDALNIRIIHLSNCIDYVKENILKENMRGIIRFAISEINFDKYKNDVKDFVKKDKDLPKRDLTLGFLEDYFEDYKIFKDYKELSESIRKYRNAIVHESSIHVIKLDGKYVLPKENKIKEYKIRLASNYEVDKIEEKGEKEDFEEFINEREKLIKDHMKSLV